jgi:hypothetical protein
MNWPNILIFLLNLDFFCRRSTENTVRIIKTTEFSVGLFEPISKNFLAVEPFSIGFFINFSSFSSVGPFYCWPFGLVGPFSCRPILLSALWTCRPFFLSALFLSALLTGPIFFNSNLVDMVLISFKIMVLGYWIDVTEPCMENRGQFECHNWKNINLIANENHFRAN